MLHEYQAHSWYRVLTCGLLLFHVRWITGRSTLDLLIHVPGLRESELLTIGEAAVIEGWVKLGENFGKSLGQGRTEHNC